MISTYSTETDELPIPSSGVGEHPFRLALPRDGYPTRRWDIVDLGHEVLFPVPETRLCHPHQT